MTNYTSQRKFDQMWYGQRLGTTVDGSTLIRSDVKFPLGRSNQWEVPVEWTDEYQAYGRSVRPIKNKLWISVWTIHVGLHTCKWFHSWQSFVEQIRRYLDVSRNIQRSSCPEVSGNIRTKYGNMYLFLLWLFGPNSNHAQRPVLVTRS